MKLSPLDLERRKAAQVALYLRDSDNAAKRPVDESLRYLISGVPVYLNGWKRGTARK